MARGQKLERQNFERVRGNSVVGELLAGSWMIDRSISAQNFDVLVFHLSPFQAFKLLVSRMKSRW